MEQAQRGHFFKYLREGCVAACITAGLAAAVLLFPPAIIGLGIPLIFVIVRRGAAYGIVPALLLIAVMYLLLGPVITAMFTLLMLPVVYVGSYVIQNRVRSFEAVVFSVGAFLMGLGLVIAFFYFVQKADPITYVLNFLDRFFTASPGTAHQFLILLNFQDVMTGIKDPMAIMAIPEADAVKAALQGIREFLGVSLPVFLSEYCVAGGLISYVVSRALLKKKDVRVAPIPAFSAFRLPRGFFAGLVVIGVLLAVSSLLKLRNFDAIFQACYSAYVVVFTAAGLSFLEFMLKRGRMNTGGRVAILVFSGLLFSFILIWVGLFDTLFKIKERIEKPDDFDGE